MGNRSKDIWRRTVIEQGRIALKHELAQILLASSEIELLAYILSQVQALQTLTEPQSLLRCFILVIEALSHHERYGGLSKKQIQDLTTLAQAVLKVAGVRPRHTPTSFLYTELHAALSAIHASSGDYLVALWEREIGNYAADLPLELEAQQQLGMGICALRLGNAIAAGELFMKGLLNAQEARTRDKLRMALVETQRLSGNSAAALDSIQSFKPMMTEADCLQNLEWQEACIRSSASMDLAEMFNLTKKGRTLYHSPYRLELFVWAGAHPKTLWSQRMPRVTGSATLKKLHLHRSSVLFSIAQSLELAYDSMILFPKRLEDIKKVLPKIKALPSIEQELLVWLYLTRWLYRCHHYQLAKICFYEYESLSKKLSSDRSRDVLGLAADLLEIDWLRKAA